MNIKILRYDPTLDDAPHFETYEVPWKENITVLEILMYIYENYDSLAIDFGCRGRVCGRCSVMLDGEAVVACYTPIHEDKDLTIEPLKGFPVIRDVVVDKNKAKDKIRLIEVRQPIKSISAEDVLSPKDPAMSAKGDMLKWCAKCLCCVAACPVVNSPDTPSSFAGPAAMVAIAYRYYDPNDYGDRVVQAVSEGIFDCAMCGICTQVCPAAIDHLPIFEELRAEAKKRDLVV
jgi:succinate dehydrogenase/fumarate reductase iron-sulfur protein